ncbi:MULTISPECIES: sulfurtransferase TusA family protein [Syntrophotalea]|jgi:alkylhydroperoxidase/carboxymuconolactone decarboxylase family protein YurZ|uniref:DUF2249 domain-containing protein n=1 Tax=Syntrophotalea acetylenica TaxID=29542 RepID=A0A1L3GHP8_SYNAC|nr:DUF2249 domain-containing protein [Syntrophotalea acetylenica]APG25430.1 hypothetical protein A7E75_10680 [Syntrophotalea acetylenica]APG43498.1 hypothetical protein A6070_04685 [Syntrophotalea acetylenica]
MQKDWEQRKEQFEIVDVRKLTGNFLPGFLKRAGQVEVGDGICVVQTFDPVPLYSAMASLGFEHVTDKVSREEYRAYFYRKENREAPFPQTGDVPLKPTALLNFKKIDNTLADIAVNFWTLTWGKEAPAIDLKTKLLLSLANGVGAGRFRQATRELIKVYSLGITVAELDELFSLLVWNGGIGTFASEIGPSPLFGAYQTIKTLEGKGLARQEVMMRLMEKFGEKNPEVDVLT